ncbi:Expansin-B15 [Camellia lanceoleosa]|uniref:Expansin-B15 n=1 Tax=Camellia lanceoleosa TaxID=1840588 RepID=A0ACC0IQH4_9ERIC|nr:Expansin-B15 [Camellia lanceoleosa]
MQRSFGAVWKLNAAMPGPLSFRITSSSGKTVVVTNVIPVGWKPGQTYYSRQHLQQDLSTTPTTSMSKPQSKNLKGWPTINKSPLLEM